MSDKALIIKTLTELHDAWTRTANADIRAQVDVAIERYRRELWFKDAWCCKSMGEFAAHFWSLPNPPKRDEAMFGTSLQIRGTQVNYCPFCGVRVGASQ